MLLWMWMGDLGYDLKAPAVSRQFSQGLFLRGKTSKSSSEEGTCWGKLDGEALPALVPVQDSSLCILFILREFFWKPGYFHFEIAYQLLTLSKKPY